MKTIRKTLIISLIFCLLTGCGLLDSTQPQLQGEEKDFCIAAVEYFEQKANALDGESMKMFLDTENINNIDLVFTHEAALEKNGQALSAAAKNAYWAVVIVNHLMPKGSEYTDLQLKQMNIEIDKENIRGKINSNVFIKGKLSFRDNSAASKNIEICMHAGQAATGGTFIPLISYIKFID